MVKALPDDIAMHGSVQACITLSLYPHVVITHPHKLALLLDELHMTSAIPAHTNSISPNDLMIIRKNKREDEEAHSNSTLAIK